MYRLALYGFAFIFSACTPRPPSARDTVDDYLRDSHVRKDVLDDCNRNPGSLQTDPDCINAQRAESLSQYGKSLRDLPPLGLEE